MKWLIQFPMFPAGLDRSSASREMSKCPRRKSILQSKHVGTAYGGCSPVHFILPYI